MTLWVPIAFYVAMTVVVPILNGSPVDRAFIEHAGVVLVVVALVVVLAAGGRRLRRYFSSESTSAAMRQSPSQRQTRA